MSAAKHTPGPWRVVQLMAGSARMPLDKSRPFMLIRHRTPLRTETMKNADGSFATFATADEARAAIAKATGTT